MKNRQLQSNKKIGWTRITAAAMLLLAAGAAAFVFCHVSWARSFSVKELQPQSGSTSVLEKTDVAKSADTVPLLPVTVDTSASECADTGWLTLTDVETGKEYARYRMKDGDWFSIGFIHSVNKSPLTNYYEIHDGKIYVEKTVYYGFGAGVQTQIEEGQTLEYGEDGSMIVSGFHREIPDLVYIVGTVSDHTLVVNGEEEISLRDLCGRHAKVRFDFST